MLIAEERKLGDEKIGAELYGDKIIHRDIMTYRDIINRDIIICCGKLKTCPFMGKINALTREILNVCGNLLKLSISFFFL